MTNLLGWHTLIIALIVIIPLVTWAIALTQIARASLEPTAKAVWVLIVVIAPILGAIAWWIIGKPSGDSGLAGRGPESSVGS